MVNKSNQWNLDGWKLNPKSLVIFGLITIPFYELLVYLSIPGVQMPALPDTRIPKEYVSLLLMIVISYSVMSIGSLKPILNKWILFFIGFAIFSAFKSPAFMTSIGTKNFTGMWNYEPIFKMLVYFLGFMSITSLDWTKQEIGKVLKVMAYCAVAMSGYVIIQKLGLDQLFVTRSVNQSGWTPSPELAGMLGQSTLVASFIAVCFPAMIYIRTKLIVVAVVALFFLNSDFAWVTVVFISVYWLLYYRKGWIMILWSMTILAVVIPFSVWCIDPDMMRIGHSGRFPVWKNVLIDIQSAPMNGVGKFCWSGMGIGSFYFIFSLMHETKFQSAHNEYLEILWGTGIIGLGLFLMGCVWFIAHAYEIESREVKALSIIFASFLVSAMGTFIFQLPAHAFYVVVVLALLNNQIGERTCIS